MVTSLQYCLSAVNYVTCILACLISSAFMFELLWLIFKEKRWSLAREGGGPLDLTEADKIEEEDCLVYIDECTHSCLLSSHL